MTRSNCGLTTLSIAAILFTRPVSGQFRNYSLNCLVPILKNIEPDAPKTLQEAFLSGPFDFAGSLEGIGMEAIKFPISTKSSEAQHLFEQGIALLHILWYQEAERAFRNVVELDPACPMGYWGLALANEFNPGRAALFAKTAVLQCDGNRPEIEKRWTRILADFYDETKGSLKERSVHRIQALESLVIDFPNNLEAKAFLIRQLTLNEYRTGIPVTSHLGVDALIQDFAEVAPAHPSRHYRLFLWLKHKPGWVVQEASASPGLSPNAAEPWRYAAETFAAAGQPVSAALFLEAALRTDHRDLDQRGLMPSKSQNLQANYRAYINLLIEAGRIEEAISWTKRALLLPRNDQDLVEGTGMENLYVDALMQSRQWERLLRELDGSIHLVAARTPADRAARLMEKGLCYLALERFEEAKEVRSQLAGLIESRNTNSVKVTEEVIKECQTRLETVHQLLSEQPSKETISAFEQFEWSALTKAAFLEQAGFPAEAHNLVADYCFRRPGAWMPMATNCRLAQKNGKVREALFGLDRSFRSCASLADSDLMLMDQLAPLTKLLNLRGKWTLPAPTPRHEILPEDLDELGPDRWRPPLAHSFELPDLNGTPRSLTDFQGKPVLLNFFLGARCPFCLEQFKAFQPHWPSFEQAGISMLAISIDSIETIKQVFANSPELKRILHERFPFPVLADPELTVFKKYGVFDQFENGPMHATILIDPNGRILWQFVSHDTYTQPVELLHEAKRLIQLHSEPRNWPG